MNSHETSLETLTLSLPAELSAALDRCQMALGSNSREEALLQGFREWAAQEGYIPSDGGLRPEELSAANDD